KLDAFDKQITATEKRIRDAVAKIDYHEPDLIPERTNSEPQDFVWVEDDFPKGAKIQSDGDKLNWVESERVFSGKRALLRTDVGRAQDVFTDAMPPLIVSTQDTFFFYV